MLSNCASFGPPHASQSFSGRKTGSRLTTASSEKAKNAPFLTSRVFVKRVINWELFPKSLLVRKLQQSETLRNRA